MPKLITYLPELVLRDLLSSLYMHLFRGRGFSRAFENRSYCQAKWYKANSAETIALLTDVLYLLDVKKEDKEIWSGTRD